MVQPILYQCTQSSNSSLLSLGVTMCWRQRIQRSAQHAGCCLAKWCSHANEAQWRVWDLLCVKEDFLEHHHLDKLAVWIKLGTGKLWNPDLVNHLCSVIWHFEKLSALLWNPPSSKEGDFPASFASLFSLVMPFSHWLTYQTLKKVISLLLLQVYFLLLCHYWYTKPMTDLQHNDGIFLLANASMGRGTLR